MYSSFSKSKHLTYILILAIQLFLLRRVSSLNLTNTYLHHKCIASEGKYQPKSDYENSFNLFSRNISRGKFKNGFVHITFGFDSNHFTGLTQCRGDSYKIHCRDCFATAFAGIKRRCPRNKGAMIWYDQCYIQVTAVKSVRTYDYAELDYDNTFSMHNQNNIKGDINLFKKKTTDLLNKLILKANNNGTNSVFYAAGEERLGTEKIYAMVQCPHFAVVCEKCLKWCISELPKCCNGKQGARVFLGTSCNIRYELYPFLRT